MDFLSLLEVTTPESELPFNATMRSERLKSEIIEIIGKTVKDGILANIKRSPVFGLICDERCDISVKEQLVLYVKYLNTDPWNAATQFLGIVELSADDAETITKAITDYLDSANLDKQKICALGSDGAAVMVGKHSGVAAGLRQQISPSLINVHCVAHPLALAIGAAGNSTMKLVLHRLDSLYRHYKHSFVRTAGLRVIQVALDIKPVALSQAVVTRWLSYDASVKSVRQCFPALILSLN